MAYAEQLRSGRFRAVYRRDGHKVSAGTWDDEATALRMAQQAEGTYQEEGEAFVPAMTLREYVTTIWDPTYDGIMEVTKVNRLATLERWVLPRIGDRRIGEITKRMVREDVLQAARDAGEDTAVQSRIKMAVGSLFRPLVEDGVIDVNPAHGIKVSNPPSKPFTLLGKDEFSKILANLPTEEAVLLAKFFSWTGMRISEALDLRASDIDRRTGTVEVRHRLTKTPRQDERYRSVVGTKSGSSRSRSLRLSEGQLALLVAHMDLHGLSGDDLVFPKRLVQQGRDRLPGPDPAGNPGTFRVGYRTYQHGTPYAYGGGRCRCEYCTHAIRVYRREQREVKPRRPRGRGIARPNPVGHLYPDGWRDTWRKACDAAGLDWYPRPYDLRHANATWLLEGGTNIYEVAQRLGHRDINTTMIYLKRLESEQAKAASIMDQFL